MTIAAPTVMFNLTPAQLTVLTNYQTAHQYPDAYRYLETIVRDHMIGADANTRRDLESTATWLDRAASINANDGSFSSEFVRGSTIEATGINGNRISESRFQEVSDGLADAVIGDVVFAPIEY